MLAPQQKGSVKINQINGGNGAGNAL